MSCRRDLEENSPLLLQGDLPVVERSRGEGETEIFHELIVRPSLAARAVYLISALPLGRSSRGLPEGHSGSAFRRKRRSLRRDRANFPPPSRPRLRFLNRRRGRHQRRDVLARLAARTATGELAAIA